MRCTAQRGTEPVSRPCIGVDATTSDDLRTYFYTLLRQHNPTANGQAIATELFERPAKD